MTRLSQRPAGFSLVELLAVVSVIGLLLALFLPAVHNGLHEEAFAVKALAPAEGAVGVPIPEPSSLALAVLAGGGVFAARRRNRARAGHEPRGPVYKRAARGWS